MKLNGLILLVTIMIGFGLTYVLESVPPQNAKEQKTQKTVEKNSMIMPDFSFTDTKGNPRHSSSFKGKFILLNFWATWCPPCVKEFPILLQLAQEYPDRIVLLAISSDQDKAAIERFIKKMDTQSTTILEQNNVILVHDQDSMITFDIFQTARLPETLIVGPEQRMLKKLVGADWDAQTVRNVIEGKN